MVNIMSRIVIVISSFFFHLQKYKKSDEIGKKNDFFYDFTSEKKRIS